ncbi:von Willebrand factor A domain-containing protein 1-like isoform X1 [Pygocentrus nattereri]|uniref:von Willebrand factor A domain-containing protein 1 n=1 Tax=Pygocentrus nattereri TaxID=42514 RepID=A0A3B4E6M8_PYGNA|nr:von Willebrand factor A domain-containing protein 1-like isoform X1 [Pygocentrus nattereri]
MRRLAFVGLLLTLSACLQPTGTRSDPPGTEFDCCEGDILLLLDSSGSITTYEFSRLLGFLTDLLRPFLLGRGQVRVGMVLVGTEPQMEFSFDAYNSQNALQEALLRTQQLRGDTNTEAALLLAQRLLRRPPGHIYPPRVLLWLTDGVKPGNVDGPMAVLRQEGVSVLAVSTGQGNYQVLHGAVSPPTEAHLYFIDIDDIGIITEDLREAIIELIRVERLQVRDVTTHSALLQWRPVLVGGLGHYELRYSSDTEERRLTLQAEQSWTELTDLQPDTRYTAWLTPHTPLQRRNTLTTSFSTLTEVLSPVSVTVSESGVDRVHVSWTPLQPSRVLRYLVEFGPIPRGDVRAVTLTGRESSTLLTQLQPHTQYLITVTAVHSSGQQRAMSVRACTQEVLPGLVDLQLTPVGSDSVKVDWRGHSEAAGLRGYWVRWETGEHSSLSPPSSRYLPAQSLSTVLTHLSPATRVCVSPVYRTARGEGLCCTAHTLTAAHGRGGQLSLLS